MRKKLTARRLSLAISLSAAFGLIFLAGLLFGTIKRPKRPSLDDPQIWLPIKVFRGSLDPHSASVDASVSAIFRLSDGQYPYTVMQNKIEVKTPEQTFRFVWQDDETFVAGWCDIGDVDEDGAKEFLLYSGTASLRIVTFTQSKFRFRPGLDDLLSFEYDVGPFDLDGDGSLEFVESEHFPADIDVRTKWLWIPRVKRWSRAVGFVDVSKEYPRYYRERVIPELERRLAEEQDPELRETISRALEYINQERL